MAQKLQHQLKEVGSKLETPPTNKDALVKLLKQAATCLSELDQSPPKSILECMQPFLDAIVKPELLKHQDREVKLLVATCLCDITRITAPEAPYSDNVLKDIFHLIVSTFSGLSDTSGPSFGRRVVILETLARYRSCVVMLDLECYDLINEMFSIFFAVASDDHSDSVITSMQTIMVVLVEESEEVQEDLLLGLLSALGRNKNDFSMAARRLAMNVIEHCAGKLEPGIKQFLISSMSGDRSLNSQIDYHEVIYDIYRCAPQILLGVVPYLTGELLTDQLDIRLKAVKLVGDLFALPGSAISETFQPIFLEFLKRLTDRVVEVRMSVLEHVKNYLLSNPFRAEAPQIISALCDRLLDYDENVRKQVVAVVCDVACHALTSVPVETVKLVAERLRDKSLLVKINTMERLAEIYRLYCLSCSDSSTKTDDYDWIPGKILRCFYDKDFRSDMIEPILCGTLFPTEFTVKDKVGNWVRVFSGFDKVEVKALEKILEQKQRLQQEMHRYLSLRQMYQDGDAPELQKKVLFCFRMMSRCFIDPAKAEENFHILDQLKDANVWKILKSLLDQNTSTLQACSYRDDLLKILGERHRLYEFLSTLSMKCSYILFNKEHVKEILMEADTQKSAGSTKLTLSCMNILVILARFSPLLLSGIEEDLIHLLEDDNEVIKEGVLHVLARAGGTIREQLGVSSSSLDLVLERICLEGTRRQAKYAVHALAAITKDDGLMSLSVLYKRLVDMLEEKTHLPAVLQSLGCIAQTAMSVFETRESEIEGFIKRNLLECSNKEDNKSKECWDDRSELCSLKIFGIKTLVKSYLPVKDAQLRLGIDGLLGLLKNILSFGEISEDIGSSSIDKAHLKLAAAKAILRLSKLWDHEIPIDVFYLTLRTSEISFPQAKRLFLNKVHQYAKDRLLDPKYACAFLLDMIESQQPNFEEDKHNLIDIVQMCQLGKVRQPSFQSDTNSPMIYPEYILPHLVHALAHHSACPNVDECKDVKAFELIYRGLYLFLSILVHGDEEGKSEVSVNKEKESISLVISIFRNIKCSEDIVEPSKSKNSHAICDLGLSITKRLVQKPDDLQGSTASVSLPPMLYKLHEKKDGDEPQASEGQTWLADESVLTHFKSLKLEANGMVHSENAEDEALKDSEIEIEIDGNEVPLGKMIKRLKAKGAKARKVVKNENLPAEKKNENDVDILGMVREINLDNLDMSCKFESSNGHEYVPGKTKIDQKHGKRKRQIVSESTNVSIPKRRRSSSAKLPKFESTEADEGLPIHSEDIMSLQENIVEPAESDLLVSCFQKNSGFLLKHKAGNSDNGDNEGHETGVPDARHLKTYKLMETNIVKANNSNLPTGSVKKRKRRSVAGLAKCTTKERGDHTMDLIGCRIKVWWPMDKKFYEGVVKSFDPQKNKHLVLYNDGDVEVLHLEKERWELIDNGRKSIKRLKPSKGLPPKGFSLEQKKKVLSGLQQNKKSTKISSSPKVRGKRTPRKTSKQGQKVVSKSKTLTDLCEAESRGSHDESDPEPPALSKVDDMDSGDSEGEQLERKEESSTGGEESDKDEKSVYEEKQVGDADNSPSDKEESEEENCKPERKRTKYATVTFHDAEASDEQGRSHSEEKQQSDVSKEASEEGADKEEQSDSQMNQEDDDAENTHSDRDESDKNTSASSDMGEAEISDDEPLSTWKRHVGKSVQGK
ncbi:sister chromatid cohesion protein PDS5 homolog A isoform X2 [Cornus florida]|uniref:sister chromatid cohesion protein PDS5 homolog A isoform X2 n=1 Tax=Cornus florida TaxID=4283 RepID=UPI0028A10284|nr:sister chromatid cohesion protein PDS5 homolog A isoform X2 [Cornus florida]